MDHPECDRHDRTDRSSGRRLELDDAGRAGGLPGPRLRRRRRRCGGEVEALLRTARRRRGASSEPPPPSGWPGSWPPQPERTTPGPGRPRPDGDEGLDFLDPSDKPGSLGRLGHYEVLEVVGRGGMGVVLKAFDENLHRVVAIKVMAPQLAASATARQRFTREARAAAAVTHDHVVTIHAVEEAGAAAVPRDAVRRRRVAPGAARPDRAAAAAGDPPDRDADGVRAGRGARPGAGPPGREAGEHPAGERRRAGQAHRLRPGPGGRRRQPDPDRGGGRHAAVHVARSRPRASRSTTGRDLFSLGSVLYAMCTGRPPFRAGTSMGVLKRVCEETPTPIRETNPEVPDWLVAVIEKLHAKDPAGAVPVGGGGGGAARPAPGPRPAPVGGAAARRREAADGTAGAGATRRRTPLGRRGRGARGGRRGPGHDRGDRGDEASGPR